MLLINAEITSMKNLFPMFDNCLNILFIDCKATNSS